MKKTLILLPFIGLFFYLSLSSWSSGPGAGGAGDHTGASGTAGCGGGGCHGTTASPGTSVVIQLLDAGTMTPVTNYIGSHSYFIQVTGTSTGSSTFPTNKFGFQTSVVKNGTTTNEGTLSAPTGGHTGSYSGIVCAEHSSPLNPTTGTGSGTTTYVVNIPWTSPTSGTGCLTIYSALNAVHFDGIADSHDQWNTTSLNITESVAAITGTTTVCVGATTTLSDATGCGTWSSANTVVATVDIATGVVTGVSAGTATISYTSGGSATTVVTVNAAPPNILGTMTVCKGSNTTLSDAAGLGTWTSSNTSVATVNLITGTVTGVTASTATITFTAASSGCKIATTVTVNPLPSAITGTPTVCIGLTTALTDAGGGAWASSNTTVATVGSGSGLVNGVTANTANITYTLPTGCSTQTTVTVNPLPSAITGTMTVCPGTTTSLTDAGGGTWTSGNTIVATVVSGSGVVAGVTGGTATITYFLPTGCTATTTVTVYPIPPTITGTTSVCAGLTTALTDATSGGTWTIDNTAIAAIGSSSGIVTAAAGPGGSANVTYTVPTTGCTTTAPLTVNPLPSAITGVTSICPGTSGTLSDASGSGNWTSGNTTIATIDFFFGTLVGVTAGTTTVTYTLGTGCIATMPITVNTPPPPINGTLSVCSGSTTTLSDATGGGTWISSNTGIATIGSSSGLVTAISTFFSTADITYTAPATGCTTIATVTVNPLPAAITGTATVCSGSTTSLNDVGAGTWSSSNTSVATVSGTGVVTGLGTGGTATITFTAGTGCSAVKTVTVNPVPLGITGIESVCSGSTTALSDGSGSGSWTSATTTAATVGSGTGIVTGLGAGGTTSVISYVFATGCKATATVTINALPAAITGASAECVGATVTLTGGGGGAWTSTNTTVATVGSGSGGVFGVSAGTTTISYTLTTTGCATTKNVTVNAAPAGISGASVICQTSTTTLSDGGGGTWGSSTTPVATITGSGIVTGTGSGTSTITFTLSSTGCTATKGITVNPLGPISGLTSLCLGLTTTLTDAAGSGTWTSSNTAVATIGTSSGFVNTLSAGSSLINYTTPAGCIATATLSVVSSPGGITGSTNACLGQTTALSDGGGGTWTSSNTSVATVTFSGGVVTGVALSTATITYSLGTGCTTTTTVTVNSLPPGITGTASVCAGGSITALTDATGGGNWSSSNTNETVGSSSGLVTGVTAGTATISYTLTTGCSAIKAITINVLPGTITGSTGVCLGSTTALSDGGSGTWTSGSTGIATINVSTGLLTSVSAGTSTIIYTLPTTGCKTNITVTVNPLPLGITGAANVCVGSATALTDFTSGGTWTSSNTNVTVGSSSGIVTGVKTGTATISYTLTTGCFVTKAVIVNPQPLGITSAGSVCVGSTTPLSDATGGGNWSSGTTTVATVGTSTGIVTGQSSGTAAIIYTLSSTGCSASSTVTVNDVPLGITGTLSLCAGAVTGLSDATGSGNWTSSNTSVATVGTSSGAVAGVSGGTSVITYTGVNGCFTITTVTVNALPLAITGAPTVCVGATTALSDGTPGGTWTSSNTSVATIGTGTGVVTGVSATTVVITYALGTGCEAHFFETVNASPSGITGTAAVCAGATTALTDITGGGNWTSSNTAIATVGSSSGSVAGIAAGTATISYTLLSGCAATVAVTVNPTPVAIRGTLTACTGLTTALSDPTGGGAWTSDNTAVATVGTGTGVVTGATAGTADIAYTLTTGCASVATVTINLSPTGITGTPSVCVSSTTALSDGVGGGTWRSSNTSVATVSGTGVVSGVLAGAVTITYTLAGSCSKTISVTVNPLPVAGTIAGATTICTGTPGDLSDAAAGGVWSSSNTTVATVGATTGIVTGLTNGFVIISYSVTNSCGTARTSVNDTVASLPSAGTIAGKDTLCVGGALTLSDAAAGGVWTSDNGNVSVSLTGIITGVTAGASVISYSVTTACGTATATFSMTINTLAFCNTGLHTVAATPDGFQVYPNPNTGVFTVAIPATASGATVTILDVLGKVMDTRTTADTRAQTMSFNLSNMPAGSYIVKVNAGDNTYRQQVIVW
jgi:uncharacterized protein YjdB